MCSHLNTIRISNLQQWPLFSFGQDVYVKAQILVVVVDATEVHASWFNNYVHLAPAVIVTSHTDTLKISQQLNPTETMVNKPDPTPIF